MTLSGRTQNPLAFLERGGEMGTLTRCHPWAQTPIGAPDGWPQSLRVAVRLILTSRHPMLIWWGQDLIQFYNDAYRQTMGPERHPSALGQSGRECWVEIWPIIGPQIHQILDGGEATWHEDQLVPVTRHGRRQDVWWTYGYSPIHDETAPNGVGGVLVVCKDVTEQHLTLEALRQSEQRLRLVQAVTKVGSFDLEMGAQQRFHSDECLALFGLAPGASLTRRQWLALMHPDDRAETLAALNQALRDGRPFDRSYRVRRADNSQERVLWSRASLSAGATGRGRRLIGVTMDVTERKRAEDAQRMDELRHLRLLFDQAPGVVAVLQGPRHVFEMANAAYLSMVGRRDIIGLPVHEALPEVVAQGFVDLLDHVYHTGEPHVGREVPLSLRRPSGEGMDLTYVDFVYQPIVEPNGSISGIFVLGHEVAEQKWVKDRLEAARKEAVRANEAKSNFLAAASHDLRQPFQAMRLFHQVLRNLAADTPKIANVVDALGKAMDSGEELLDALLDLSTLDAGQVTHNPAAFGAHDFFAELANEYAEIVTRKTLRFRCVRSDVMIVSDRVLLKRIVRNLLNNALRYTSHGGILLGGRRQGDCFCIQVVDTGIGIPAEHIDRVHDEFYQIDNDGRDRAQGLGLGLAIVKKTAQLLGHDLTIASQPGKGSVFGIRVRQAG
jgi:PAS domain S-box-containing protein